MDEAVLKQNLILSSDGTATLQYIIAINNNKKNKKKEEEKKKM